MKILGIMFCVMFIVFIIFGNVKFSGRDVSGNLFAKAIGGLIFSFFTTLILGLPILGIISLLN